MKTRKLLQKLIEHTVYKEYSIITGARQIGKTTLLNQLHDYLKKDNKTSYFLTLEDYTILNELNTHPENIFKFFKLNDDNKTFLLIDEIQYLDNPTNFLKLLYDKYSQKLKLIVTGSSAFYLDSKFKDSLSGRKRIFELYTIDFEEYLDFVDADKKLILEYQNIKQENNYISLQRFEIENHFNDFLLYGGYPAIVLANNVEDKKLFLKEIFNSYIKKDISEAGILNHDKFYKLLVLLAHQSGNLLNINELSNTLNLSSTAINNYLHILVKSFHIDFIKPFYNNIRKELTKMSKVYFNDLGLRNIIINNFNLLEKRIDKGIIVENYIYTRLRDLYGKENINYWRTSIGDEIDFVYTNKNNLFAIESKYNFKEYKISKYKKFQNSYPEISINCYSYISENNFNKIITL